MLVDVGTGLRLALFAEPFGEGETGGLALGPLVARFTLQPMSTKEAMRRVRMGLQMRHPVNARLVACLVMMLLGKPVPPTSAARPSRSSPRDAHGVWSVNRGS